ncbi:MAG: MBL fold metallo-hydrolase [Rubrobacter sp.]|nr:MBL fold metallo-hydrolase [Rubrobacter sp.]
MARDAIYLGSTTVHILDDGVFITDAGNLFGGSRKARIRGAMHPVLVATGESLVLLDAGFGPELPESLAESYELQRERNLLENLSAAGYSPADVTHVVLSHLDADHVGWALRSESFPRATVYVQEASLEEARNLEESHGRREAIPAVERGLEEGWCELLDGGTEIVAGLRTEVRAGHAAGHQISWIGSGEESVLFTADLAPSKIFLDPDTIAGVDTDPEAARRNRIEVLSEAVEREAPVILYHEPKDSLVSIRRTEKGFQGIPYGE